MPRLRCLGVLLCYNDGDLLEESIRYLLEQDHHLIVWDHGSTDETPSVIKRFRSELLEAHWLPREFDFYELYAAMSRHLIEEHARDYDWISWPDQDEFLEGPGRDRSYRDYLLEAHESKVDWIRFNNFNYWWTARDDPNIASPTSRVRGYSLWPDCPPRVRAWRAPLTNIREFNHNPLEGTPAPRAFNLRHYPMRSRAQMRERILSDRAGLRRGHMNFHYEVMAEQLDSLEIPAEALHYDDGVSELDHDPIFDWSAIYWRSPVGPG